MKLLITGRQTISIRHMEDIPFFLGTDDHSVRANPQFAFVPKGSAFWCMQHEKGKYSEFSHPSGRTEGYNVNNGSEFPDRGTLYEYVTDENLYHLSVDSEEQVWRWRLGSDGMSAVMKEVKKIDPEMMFLGIEHRCNDAQKRKIFSQAVKNAVKGNKFWIDSISLGNRVNPIGYYVCWKEGDIQFHIELLPEEAEGIVPLQNLEKKRRQVRDALNKTDNASMLFRIAKILGVKVTPE